LDCNGTGVIAKPSRSSLRDCLFNDCHIWILISEVTIVKCGRKRSLANLRLGPGEGTDLAVLADKVNWFCLGDCLIDLCGKATRAMIPGKVLVPIYEVYIPGSEPSFFRKCAEDTKTCTGGSILNFGHLFPFPQTDAPRWPKCLAWSYPIGDQFKSGANGNHWDLPISGGRLLLGTNETAYWLDGWGFNQYMNILSDAASQDKALQSWWFGSKLWRILRKRRWSSAGCGSANDAGPATDFNLSKGRFNCLSMLGGIVGDESSDLLPWKNITTPGLFQASIALGLYVFYESGLGQKPWMVLGITGYSHRIGQWIYRWCTISKLELQSNVNKQGRCLHRWCSEWIWVRRILRSNRFSTLKWLMLRQPKWLGQ